MTDRLVDAVARLRDWAEVESVPDQEEFDSILAELESLVGKPPARLKCMYCGAHIEKAANNVWMAVRKLPEWDRRTCPARDDGKYTHHPAASGRTITFAEYTALGWSGCMHDSDCACSLAVRRRDEQILDENSIVKVTG